MVVTREEKRTDRLLHFSFSEKYSEIDPYKYLEIFQKPNWYVEFDEMFREFFYSYTGREKKTKEWLKKREEIVKMVEELLRAKLINLGEEGKNHDAERKNIDYAIIHHTSTKYNTRLTYIDALSLIRLYARIYSDRENSEYGKPIWSNHLMNGRQTFMPYHYVIMRDGSFERCLNDEMIGWHAGNWDINCRSIGIAFLDDLEDSNPSDLAMQTAINILKKYNISSENVLGHREVNDKTTCPGKKFYNWKFLLTGAPAPANLVAENNEVTSETSSDSGRSKQTTLF